MVRDGNGKPSRPLGLVEQHGAWLSADLAIVLFFGFPAAGKLTMATELVRLLEDAGRPARLVDNHYVNKPIFGLLDIDGVKPVPPEAWGRIREVRTAMIETIRMIAPPDWTYVFTNYLAKGQDEWVLEEFAQLAEDRGARFLVVRIDCDLDELCRRIDSPERKARLKWTDAEGLRARHATIELVDVPGDAESLVIDSTAVDPVAGARLVLDALS